jgi:hypothetical protein
MPEQFLDDGELDGLLDTGDGVAWGPDRAAFFIIAVIWL